MIYFVPAWYKDYSWSENEQYWYRRRMRSEFDETIKQIQLFHRNMKTEYKIFLMSYAPNLRHFLHRQSLYRAPYWSCFDAIQEIKRTKIAVLSFHNLNWPEGTEFIYSPFAIVAFLKGEKYAQIEFGEDGNMILIDMFENGQICRRNFYDDRGFVSSTLVFENGQPHHQDYLDENAKWKMREYMSDEHVEINPQNNHYLISFYDFDEVYEFESLEYNSIEDVVEEVSRSYIDKTTYEDKFITAIHSRHLNVLWKLLQDRNIIATFFEERFDYQRIEEITPFLDKATHIVTDSKQAANIIRGVVDKKHELIRDISPYDARMDLGISTQLNVQNILIPVDGLSDVVFRNIIVQVAKYLMMNDKARVHLFTRNGNFGVEEHILKIVAEILEQEGFDSRLAIESVPKADAEMDIDMEEEQIPDIKFFVNACVDERTLSKCINEQRVVLDFRAVADMFLFITSISKGVPRISIQKDQYFEHKENGYLISNYKDIISSLDFYLGHLDNWNAAVTSCVRFSKEFTTKILIDSWREVLSSNE